MKKAELILLAIGLIIAYFAMKILIPKNMLNNFDTILQEIKQQFGREIAANVEKIYKLETGNFTSKQFELTFSPGMMAFSDNYPYGWQTISKMVWGVNPEYKPTGYVLVNENPGLSGTGGGLKKFIKFPTLKAAMFTVAGFLQYYNNNPGRWYSTDLAQQEVYNKKINSLNTIFV